MRVISGSARGRRLKPVPGDGTRPVTDRVKTALFDILRPTIEGARVLDLFAGSGGVGIEALSQGAGHCVFLDMARAAVKTIHENLETTGLAESAEVRHTDAFAYLRATRKTFDLIYVAPPQYKNLWVEALHAIAERPALLQPGGLVVAQIDPHEYEKLELSALQEEEERKYGSTLLIFYRSLTEKPAEGGADDR